MRGDTFPSEYEQLSAYLDGQLEASEHARIEARLSMDPELSGLLGELQATRAMLRRLPRLRAPRNFTLSPRAARARIMTRFYPVLGVASALATFLLILTIVGDVFLLSPQRAAPGGEASVAMEMEVSTTEEVAVQEEAPLRMEATVLVEGSVEGQGYPPPSEITLESPVPSMEVFMAPAEPLRGTPTPSPTPTVQGRLMATSPAGITPTARGTSAASDTMQGLATPTLDIIGLSQTAQVSPTYLPSPYIPPWLSPTPAPPSAYFEETYVPPADEIIPTPVQTLSITLAAPPTASPTPESSGRILNYLLQTTEILLGLLAVVSGIAAIFLRWRARQ